MEGAAVEKLPAPESKSSLFISAGLALAIYLILDAVEGFIALPLREISSVIATLLLNSISYAATRNGTIISTDNFTFEVVPACSGSTTLRVLMLLGIIWCGIHRNLTWPRRFLCIGLAVPIAIIANSIRVAALVLLGDFFMEPVEGVPHVLVGVFTFVLALGFVFLLTELLATQTKKKELAVHHKKAMIAALLLIAYIPIFIWFLKSWGSSPNDHYGFIFTLLGWSLWTIWWFRNPDSRETKRWPLFLFGAGVLFYAQAALVDIRILKAWSFLVALFAMAWFFKGRKFALTTSPLLAIAYLGFPTVVYQITSITSKTLGFGGRTTSLAIEVLAAVAFLLLFWMIRPQLRQRKEELFSSSAYAVPLNVLIFLSVTSIFLQFLINNRPSSLEDRLALEFSFLQGDWIGQSNPISEGAIASLGAENIISRRYYNNEQFVDVIITSTDGNRHNAHPPEYCMTGAGWKVLSQTKTNHMVNGDPTRMVQFELSLNTNKLDFVYWFTDGTTQITSYHDMLREDMLRRMRGERTDWYLFRVMGRSNSSSLTNFLSSMNTDFRKPPQKETGSG